MVTSQSQGREAFGGWIERSAARCLNNRGIAARETSRDGAHDPPAEHGTKSNVNYSVRNAVIGLTLVARRAGKKQASNDAAASNKLEVTSANGSFGLTS